MIDIINIEFNQLSEKMERYRQKIRNAAIAGGFKICDSEAPITSIVAGSSQKTLEIAKYLYENNILSTPFVYPSVPLDSGKVRLIAGANLKEETVDSACKIIASAGFG